MSLLSLSTILEIIQRSSIFLNYYYFLNRQYIQIEVLEKFENGGEASFIG